MSHDIVLIGYDTGHNIVLGSEPPPPSDGAELRFELPSALEGVVMLALVVRNDNTVACTDETWELAASGGAGGLFLDAFTRIVDGSPGSLPGELLTFVSLAEQELQGGLVLIRRPFVESLIVDLKHGAFVADRAPTTPPVEVVGVDDYLLSVISIDGTTEIVPSAKMTEIDEYGSSVFESRETMIAARKAGVVGAVTPEAASAAVPVTGRGWTLAIRTVPRITNPSRHAAREHPSPVTNPSGHARKM